MIPPPILAPTRYPIRRMPMRKLSTALCLVALAPAAFAQNDKIIWTDGTVADRVKVLDYTWDKIKFRKGGSTEQRSADAVARVIVAKVDDAYRRAYGATNDSEKYSAFLTEADKLAKKDPFLAQFGYIEAARLLRRNGQMGEAFTLLEEKIQSQLPDSGFYPEVFRFKLDYYLGQGKDKASSAATVAKKFRDTAVQKGWPDGFVHEADYYGLMVQVADGSVSGNQLEGKLKGLLGRTEGSFPQVAGRIKVQLADSQRQANQIDDARKTYQDLVDNSPDEATRAQALLGLGHTYFAEGDSTNTEPYRQALLLFLRVYLEAPNAPDELRAEALYHGSLSSEKWRGRDSGAMARRLRGLLRRDYPESTWANR